MTAQEAEFTVSGFRQWVKGGFRGNKGKKHNYPKEQKKLVLVYPN